MNLEHNFFFKNELGTQLHNWTISYISSDFDPFTGASNINSALFDTALQLKVINVMCVMKS